MRMEGLMWVRMKIGELVKGDEGYGDVDGEG